MAEGADGWSRTAIVIGALNPLLLLVGGYFLNEGINSAKLSLDQDRAQIEANSAKIADLKSTAETASIVLHQRVDKVKVISDFISDLSGSDERRRGLAIEAIFIALPDEATRLVKVVEQVGGGGVDRSKDSAAARGALDGTRARLLVDMFADTRLVRVEALGTLLRGWTNDQEMADRLVDRAMQDVQERAAGGWSRPTDPDSRAAQQLASIYNAVAFLVAMRPPTDARARARIAGFAEAAAPNSPDTQRLVATLRQRLQ